MKEAKLSIYAIMDNELTEVLFTYDGRCVCIYVNDDYANVNG